MTKANGKVKPSDRCHVPGCCEPRVRSILGNSLKCIVHKDICPHCWEREGNGSWGMGYCEECQGKLVDATIYLPCDFSLDPLDMNMLTEDVLEAIEEIEHASEMLG